MELERELERKGQEDLPAAGKNETRLRPKTSTAAETLRMPQRSFNFSKPLSAADIHALTSPETHGWRRVQHVRTVSEGNTTFRAGSFNVTSLTPSSYPHHRRAKSAAVAKTSGMMRSEPNPLPLRAELERAVALYIAAGGARALRCLPARDRESCRRAVRHTTHPSALLPAFLLVDARLRSRSYPAFVLWTRTNSSPAGLLLAIAAGLALLCLGFGICATLVLYVSLPQVRVVCAALGWPGLTVLISSLRGLNLLLYVRGLRQLQPWEEEPEGKHGMQYPASGSRSTNMPPSGGRESSYRACGACGHVSVDTERNCRPIVDHAFVLKTCSTCIVESTVDTTALGQPLPYPNTAPTSSYNIDTTSPARYGNIRSRQHLCSIFKAFKADTTVVLGPHFRADGPGQEQGNPSAAETGRPVVRSDQCRPCRGASSRVALCTEARVSSSEWLFVPLCKPWLGDETRYLRIP